MPLVLSRHLGQRVRIGLADRPIWVRVVRIHRGQVRLEIDAPREVEIMREEVLPHEPDAPVDSKGT